MESGPCSQACADRSLVRLLVGTVSVWLQAGTGNRESGGLIESPGYLPVMIADLVRN